MVIEGSWELCDDGQTRPILRGSVRAADGALVAEDFLIDSGADRTVFSATLAARLQLPGQPLSPGSALCGVGGRTDAVLVSSSLHFLTDAGQPVRIHGEFASFTDPEATDLSILGRDVSDHFDLLLSRRKNQVVLLAGEQCFRVAQG